jgi:hypothetical protein
MPLFVSIIDTLHVVFAHTQSFSTGCDSLLSLLQISRPTLVGVLLSQKKKVSATIWLTNNNTLPSIPALHL